MLFFPYNSPNMLSGGEGGSASSLIPIFLSGPVRVSIVSRMLILKPANTSPIDRFMNRDC